LDLRNLKLTDKDFKMIYDLHFDDLRRYLIYRSGDQQLSEDIAQNVFMKAWTKKIELVKGDIKSLLFKMATDEFISHIRRKNVERTYANSIDLKLIAETDSRDDQMIDKKRRFEMALNQLSEKQRTTLLMNKIQGLTYKEISETLNLSQKAIEKRISQALKALKNNLNQG
jgi:RNA polymerase sigma factor (sigma-70 family)